MPGDTMEMETAAEIDERPQHVGSSGAGHPLPSFHGLRVGKDKEKISSTGFETRENRTGSDKATCSGDASCSGSGRTCPVEPEVTKSGTAGDEAGNATEAKNCGSDNKGINGMDTPDEALSSADFEVQKATSSFSSMDEEGRSSVSRAQAAAGALAAAKQAEQKAKLGCTASNCSDEKDTAIKATTPNTARKEGNEDGHGSSQASVEGKESVPTEERASEKDPASSAEVDISIPIPRVTASGTGKCPKVAPPANPFKSPFQRSCRKYITLRSVPFPSVVLSSNDPRPAVGSIHGLAGGTETPCAVATRTDAREMTEKERNEYGKQQHRDKQESVTERCRRNAPYVAEERRRRALRKAVKDAEIADFKGVKITEWKQRERPLRPLPASTNGDEYSCPAPQSRSQPTGIRNAQPVPRSDEVKIGWRLRQPLPPVGAKCDAKVVARRRDHDNYAGPSRYEGGAKEARPFVAMGKGASATLPSPRERRQDSEWKGPGNHGHYVSRERPSHKPRDNARLQPDPVAARHATSPGVDMRSPRGACRDKDAVSPHLRSKTAPSRGLSIVRSPGRFRRNDKICSPLTGGPISPRRRVSRSPRRHESLPPHYYTPHHYDRSRCPPRRRESRSPVRHHRSRSLRHGHSTSRHEMDYRYASPRHRLRGHRSSDGAHLDNRSPSSRTPSPQRYRRCGQRHNCEHDRILYHHHERHDRYKCTTRGDIHVPVDGRRRSCGCDSYCSALRRRSSHDHSHENLSPVDYSPHRHSHCCNGHKSARRRRRGREAQTFDGCNGYVCSEPERGRRRSYGRRRDETDDDSSERAYHRSRERSTSGGSYGARRGGRLLNSKRRLENSPAQRWNEDSDNFESERLVDKRRKLEVAKDDDREQLLSTRKEKKASLVPCKTMHRRYRQNKESRPLGSISKLELKNRLKARSGERGIDNALGHRRHTLNDDDFKRARRVLADVMKQRGEELDRLAQSACVTKEMPSWYGGVEPVQDIVNVFADLGNDGFLPFLAKLMEMDYKARYVWQRSLPLFAQKFRDLGMHNFANVALQVDNLFRDGEVAKGLQLASAARLQLSALMHLLDTPAMHEYFAQVRLEEAASITGVPGRGRM